MRDENFLPSLLGNSIINEIEEKGRDNDGSVEREKFAHSKAHSEWVKKFAHSN